MSQTQPANDRKYPHVQQKSQLTKTEARPAHVELVPTPHAVNVEEVARALHAHPSRGLDGSSATQLIEHHGYNELQEKPTEPAWKRLARQFNDLTIWILIGAAVISAIVGEWIDCLVILAIVLLNGLMGFLQEDRAGRALLALQKLTAPKSRVIREGMLIEVPARELVPGDRVEIEAGDLVPADLRLVHSAGLRVLEAALTGESVPVDKDHRPTLHETTPLAERQNMAYMGTAVDAGKAGGIVVATGMGTQLGQIAGMLDQYEAEPTPLQRRLNRLGKMLAIAVGVIAAIIFTLQLARGGKPINVLLLSISLAVAAAPEGLPAVITIALALGLQRMARRNALIRRLPSVETLGSVTVICSDKTGTLTRNEMTVREIVVGSGHFDVTGSGYAPVGEFHKRDSSRRNHGIAVDATREPDLWQALTVAAWCNHAVVAPVGSRDNWGVIGDPTEGALVVAALKAGIPKANSAHELGDELPFDSQRKTMSVLACTPAGLTILTKGAPEVILDMCSGELCGGSIHPLTASRRKQLLELSSELAGRALRVLALAYRGLPEGAPARIEESDLILAGMVGMMDPPREEAKVAVHKCHTAGVRPVMITGDHPQTALAIARELGIAGANSIVMSGLELERLSDQALAEVVDNVSVYARVSPEQKLRIVRALKARGHIVAMTGDGVNDAPAVKAADIGIAMGITGTDVTKQVSDMVLTDDNFSSIVAAVEEGRGIYENIQKFVHYLLASNTSEVLLMFCAALVGWPAPLLAIQILWINLITDGLPALALGVEPTEPGVMSRPPRRPSEPIISLRRGLIMLWQGGLIAAVTATAFAIMYRQSEARLPVARTAAFCTIAFAQLFFAFGCRSRTVVMPKLGYFSNPQLLGAILVGALVQTALILLPATRHLLKAAPLTAGGWVLVLGLALLPVTFVELPKLIWPLVRTHVQPAVAPKASFK
jgi:Ca2+-transporting ATPase